MCVLGRALLSQERLCERVAERGPEDNQGLLVGWQGQVAHPAGVFGGPEGVDARWQHAAGVPSVSLPQVNLDASMRLQTRLQDVENGTRTRAARGYRCHPKRRRGPPLAAALPVWPAELGAARAQTSQASGGRPVRPLRLARRHAPRRCRRTTSIVRPGHRIAARTAELCDASWKNMLARQTWSKAPTPSTDSTVALWSASMAARRRRARHSVPARVDRAY